LWLKPAAGKIAFEEMLGTGFARRQGLQTRSVELAMGSSRAHPVAIHL